MTRADDVLDLLVVPVEARPDVADAKDEDVLDVGHPRRLDAWADLVAERLRRVPMKVRAAVGAVLVAAGAVGVAVGVGSDNHAPADRLAGIAPIAGPFPDRTLLDLHPGATGYRVDPPSCPGGYASFDRTPSHGSVAALRAYLPGFAVVAGMRSYQASGASCGVALYAHDAGTTSLSLTVTAPPAGPAGESLDFDERSLFVAVHLHLVTASGWTIDIEMTGHSGWLAPTAQMRKIAHDARLAA